jgi:hypothetical protein
VSCGFREQVSHQVKSYNYLYLTCTESSIRKGVENGTAGADGPRRRDVDGELVQRKVSIQL